MRTLQALGVMALWTIAFLGIMNWLNIGDHNREPALGCYYSIDVYYYDHRKFLDLFCN